MGIKNIIVNETELNTYRVDQIRQLVKIISANKNIYPSRVPSKGYDKIVFCVTDNQRITDFKQFNITSEINERFKTKNPLFNASYYEIWDKIIDSKQNYRLSRIYFHLYSSEQDKEYILLHTDPIDTDSVHGDYKRSPHLHIKETKDSTIAHAHLALNINDYNVALSSLEELNNCFRNHIEMLSHQILQIR
ncbi:MAG: hypothetical protein ABSF81_17065 [Bacteroidales bacterium]